MDKSTMTIDEAIQKHGAMAVFEAGATGECEDYTPLKALGLGVETIADAEQISGQQAKETRLNGRVKQFNVMLRT